MRRNIRFVFQQPELLATLSVVAVLIAGALTKVGHAWWGIDMISVLCIFAIIVEQPVSAQRIGRALGDWRHAFKSTQSTTKQASFPSLESIQA